VCLDGTPEVLDVTYVDGVGLPTYQWYVSDTCNTDPSTATLITGAESSSYAPPSDVEGTQYYFVELIFPEGGCGSVLSDCAEVEVVPDPVVSITSSLPTAICEGGSINDITVSYTGGVGTPSYQWYDDNGLIAGATSSSYNPGILTVAGSYEYYVELSFLDNPNNGCDLATSDTVTVTVVTDPTLTDLLTTQTVCQNSPSTPLEVTASGGTGVYSYQWYNDGGLIVGATLDSFTPPTDVVGTFNYYVVVTTDASGCEVTSTTSEVIVNPGPAIDSQPLASQTVCLDGTPEVLDVTYVDGVGLPTYQWYVSDTCNTDPSTATLITGAESSSYAPPSDVEGTQYYFVELIFPEGGCGSVLSDCAEVEVVPDPVVSITSSLPTAICEGGSINDITVSYTGGVGTPSYQWYDDNGLIAGATSSSYNPGILTVAGSYEYYVELSFLDNPNNGCDLATSDTVTVTVVTDPTLTDLLTTQTVCQNSPSTPLEVTASGGTGVYSYQWYNDDGLIVGATLDSFTPPTDVVGTFNYYVVVTTDASGCEVTSTTSEVIVNPGPAIDSQPLASQTVCLDGTPEVLDVTYVDGVGLPTYQWYVSDTCNTDPSTATLITGAESSSYAPPSDVEGTQYYFVELIFPEGGCGSVLSDCAEVEVVPDPVVSITSSLPTAICEGGSINDITVSYTGGVGTPSYQWYDDNGLIAGATSSSYNPGILTVAGSYDYYVELSFLDDPNNGCDLATSDTVTVTVVTDPTLTDLLTTQTVCQNSPSTPLEVTASGGTGVYSYQWYNDDGLIVGAALDSFTPPTDVAGTFNYYVVVTTDASGCEVTSTTSEVIVNPGPAIDSQPLASQTVCLDGTPEVLEVTYVDGVGLPTYQWYVSDTCNTDPSAATLITGAESSSYAPPSDVEGTQYYFVELVFPEGGCGSVVSDCAEVEVVPDPVVSITSSLPTAICEGGSINDITVSYTGGVGTPSYQWYDDNGLITGATSSSYNPGILTVAGSYDYYVELSFLDDPNNGCDLATSDTVTVTVVTDPTLTDLLTTQTVCQNSPSTPLEVTASGGTGVYSYQWYNDDGLIVGAALDSFTPPTDVAGTFNYYVVVTTDASGCEVTSTTSEVIVNPGPAIDSQPLASQAVCLDGTPEVLEVTYVDGVGLPTYQWYVSDTCNTDPSAATLITGAESSSYAPPSDVEGTQYYFVELVFPEGGCGSVVSDCAEVEVVPDPVVSITSSLPTAICEGGSINDITVSYTGGVGTPSYQWYDDNGLIAGATSSSYNPGILTVAGSYDYYVELSFLDDPNNGCDLATSDTVTVTVVTDPTLTDLLTTQTVCQNSPSTPLEVTASGGTGVYSYQWYNDGGLIVGATLDSFTPPTDVVGTFNYYVVVTTDASGCEVTSTTSEVIVNPGPAIDSQPLASQTLCLDGTPEVLDVTYVDGVGLPTYQWYVSDTCNTDPSTATLITGAESSSYAPPSDVEGTQYYFVELVFPEGGCGSVLSDCAEVEVVPDPVVSITSSLPTAICEGGSINDITVSYTGGVGTPSYQWYDDNGLITGATSSSYNPGILTVSGSYEYYVELSFLDNPNNGCDLATSDTVIVTVVTDPTLTDLLTTQTVCQNSPSTPLEVTASGGTGVYSYQWYNDGGLIVGATLDSFTPPTDVVGTFNYYVVVTTDASGCEVTSTTSEVIVNPDPNIETQPLILQEVCQFESTIPLDVTYVDGVGLPTYQWYVSDTCNTDPSTATLITGAESSSYAPPSDVEGTQYYFVELIFPEGGCGSVLSDCAEVEVKPVAIISDVLAEICDDSSYVFSPIDGTFPDSNTTVPDQTTYSWDVFSTSGWDGIGDPPITGGQVGLQEDNLIAFDSGTLENNTTELQIAIFEVTPWTNGCPGTSFNVELTVSPSPEMNEVITNIECSYSEPLCAGSIEINPVGMLPFTYSWVGIGLPPLSNPTSKDQFDLCPGIYELTITDSSSCSYVYEYEIAPPEPVGFDLISLTDISCNNVDSETCDGSIIVETVGGELPFNLTEWYTESIPDSGIFDLGPLINIDNPLELINACEGNYILKVLDANFCEFISPVYNIEKSADSIILDEVLSNYNGYNISCFGANDGSLTIGISGGSGNFEYNFVDSVGITIETGAVVGTNNTLIFDFLVSDEYTLYISDSNCDNEIIRNYDLTQPEELVVSAELVEPASCFGSLATYNITASGGIPPYLGTGLQEVLSGSVTFIVSDANGCVDDFSTVVSEPEDLLASFSAVDAQCFGDLGTISIIPSGGSGLITVSLFDEDDLLLPPTLNTSDGVEVIFNQPAGTYFFEIEDENDCSYGPIAVTIDHPDPILVDLEIIQPDCNTIPSWEFNNGSICVTITGGTNPFPIGNDWINNGAGQWCLLNLSEGTYPINITDDNGCSPLDLIPDVNLISPPEITVSFNDTLTVDCDTDTATQTNFIFVNGGVPPYVITWSGGNSDPSTPNEMETTEPGNYSAFVNDQFGISNGCPPIEFPLDPITFFEFGVSDFTIDSVNNDFCEVFAITDPVAFANISTGDVVNFIWNFGDGSPQITNVDNPIHVYDVAGTYTIDLTVEDLYGCFDTYSQTIEITKGYEIILPNAFTPNGDNINETIRPVYNCMTEIKMSIYDTWGSLIYVESSNGDLYGWDGTIDGNIAENGNYIMVVEAVTFNGVVIDLNGPVTLIR
jgi:gliding motility-associated-like protein